MTRSQASREHLLCKAAQQHRSGSWRLCDPRAHVQRARSVLPASQQSCWGRPLVLSRADTWGPGQVCLGNDIQRQPHLPLPAPCSLHLCLNLKRSLRSPGSSHQGGDKGLPLLSSTLGPLSQPRATRSGSRPQAARHLTQPCIAVPIAFQAALVLLWGRCDVRMGVSTSVHCGPPPRDRPPST